MCARVFMCIGTGMCMCIWKPEVSLNSYSSGAVYLACEGGPFHLPGSHEEAGQVHQQAPGICVALPGQALHMVSGSHACTVSTTDNHLPRPP